jgi:hypothetical protein
MLPGECAACRRVCCVHGMCASMRRVGEYAHLWCICANMHTSDEYARICKVSVNMREYAWCRRICVLAAYMRSSDEYAH